jgi:hypothetical protein
LLAAASAPVGITADTGAPAFAPTLPGIQRYEAIWKRSPFIVETVAVQTTEGLATKYAVTAIVSIGGKPMVFLMDRLNQTDPAKSRFTVTKEKPANGIELVEVKVDRDPRKSTAVLKQGAQQAVLSYDPALFGPAAGAGMVTSPNPGAIPPPPMGNVYPPPTGSAPPANRSRVISDPNAAAPPMGNVPPPPSRRIIRPAINVDN